MWTYKLKLEFRMCMRQLVQVTRNSNARIMLTASVQKFVRAGTVFCLLTAAGRAGQGLCRGPQVLNFSIGTTVP